MTSCDGFEPSLPPSQVQQGGGALLTDGVWRPRKDSNLRSRLRRAVLYPLSYGGSGGDDHTGGSRGGGNRRGPRRQGVDPAGGSGSRAPGRRRYPERVNPEQLSDLIVASLADLSTEGAITLPGGLPESVTVERPRQKGHGDYATNVALQLAKQAGQPPRDFAGLVAARLETADGIAGVEVAGPGFLNISVDAGAQGQVADDVVAAGAAYGGSEAGQKQKVDIEFVSANPTGPVTLA